MRQWIGYGSEKLEFTLPAGSSAYELCPHAVPPQADPRAEIARVLDEPYGAALPALIRPGARVCILCDDVSRPTPAALILEVLLPRLHALGARASDIFFVLALGSHRKMTEAEIDAKLGKSVSQAYQVFQSSFDDPAQLLDLGDTDTGVNITVFRAVMQSDVRIGIGNIVPHNTLGWSGGAKILFPGVTSEHTVAQFHMKAMMRLPERVFGSAENSVRHDVEKWTEKIGLHFIVNTVLNSDGNICNVVAGHHVQAHRAGVALARRVYGVAAPERADIVVVDSHPSDGDFWQGTKGFNAADVLLRDGGAAILCAPCYEGVGPHPEYVTMIGRDDATALLEQIYRDGWGDMDPLAIAVGALLSRMRQRFSMYVYSHGMTHQELALAGMRRANDLTALLAELNEKYGGHAKIAIVRCGAETVPLLEQE